MKTLAAVFVIIAAFLLHLEYKTHAYKVHRITGVPISQILDGRIF